MDACEWPVEYVGCDCPALDELGASRADAPDTPSGDDKPTVREIIEQTAGSLLWNITGRRFGLCSVTLRPCSPPVQRRPSTFQGRGPYPSGRRLDPVWIDGELTGLSCGCFKNRCRCSVDRLHSIKLPGPVDSITEIKVDGTILPDTSYRIDYGNVLIRTDGRQWPAVQDLLLSLDRYGTFGITYLRGVAVPMGGRLAAGVLACELAKAYSNDSSCRLPKRVQTVTRQGVTVGFLDRFEGLEEGRTGIWEIDSWVMSENKREPRPSILSPDAGARRGIFS